MTSVVAGDTIWVADDHNEAPSTNLTINFPGTAASPNVVICADHTIASPTSADWRTGGIIATTGNNGLTVAGSAYIYGLTWTSGISATIDNGLTIGQGSWQYFDTCVLRLATTSSSGSSRVAMGQTGNNVGNRVILDNTQMHLSAVQQNVQLSQGSFVWRNTANPFPNQVPTIFANWYFQPFSLTFECVDLAAMDSSRTLIVAGQTWYRVGFYGCRLGGATISTAITTPGSEVVVCQSGTNAASSQLSRYSFEGSEQTDYTIARVAGANDTVGAFARSYTPTTNAIPSKPFVGLSIAKWNATISTNLTITLYWIRNAASGLPTNAQIWFEVQYFSDTGLSPLMTIDHCSPKPNYLATATTWTADTSDWTAGSVTARGNTQAYALNASIKLASNAGRVFFCTTAGTSAGSEPAGYASAVDGGSVTDGTAVFRAGTRFKTDLTISSPQVAIAGPIYVVPRIASLSGSVPFIWLDPVVA